MTKDLTPQSFIECWKSFTEENSDDLLSGYDSDTEMTRKVIGKDSPISPFGDFFRNKFDREYDYRREDGSIDLSIYKPDSINGIQGMNPNKDKKIPLLKFYHILIEHENNYKLAFEEMHKLTNFRSALKVLITYYWNPAHPGENWDFVHDRLCKNFMEIIVQSNEILPE